MPVHGIDNGNNKHEVYTTEELLAILQQAIDSGSLQGIDPSRNPIVAAVREGHNNSDVTFWSGTEAEFNELTGVTSELVGARIGSDGKLYLLTGDTTLSDTVEAARQAALEATEGMKREVISVTLTADGWSDTAPYTQTVAVAGMTADKDFLAPYLEPSGNEANDQAAQIALSCISGGTTDTDSVTFYCYDEKPQTTITVYMVDKGTKLESSYPVATASTLGMVKVGEGLNVDESGEISLAGAERNLNGFFFDTVADMQEYNLAEGDTATTLGYYAVGDGGAATYRISDSGTADGGKIIALDNGLKAQLIIKDDTVNVKQFGAKGDGDTDDTAAFTKALAAAKKVIVNSTDSSYMTKYIVIPEGKRLVGEDKGKVQIDINRGSSTVIPKADGNTSMENIFINALDENLSNNRFDIRDCSDVTINNCTFKGFRASNRNAWGILLTRAKKVNITNCYFDDNTQSDIAIVEGCENITIEGCNGTAFHINVEPQYSPKINNVRISQCNIYKLDLRENQYVYTTGNNFTVINCVIDLLEYDGNTVSFENCTIKDYQTDGTNGAGGIINFINTGNFSENLLSDPYLNTFSPSVSATTPWRFYYSPIGAALAVAFEKYGDENILTINPSHTATKVTIQHEPIGVTYGKKYILKLKACADFTQGAASISKMIRLDWLNDQDEVVLEGQPSMFRGAENSVVPLHYEYLIMTPPEGATKLRLCFYNSPWGKQSVSIASAELFEIKSNEEHTTQLVDLPINTKRVYTASAAVTNMNYSAGDIMYYSAPTTHVGKVCTGSTTASAHTATWKDFGAIDN